MLNSNYILTFGLKERENKIIKNHLDCTKCKIITTENYTDLITESYFLSIINGKKLNHNESNDLIEFYLEVDSNLSKKIILDQKPNTLSDASKATIFTSFEDLEKNIDKIIEKAYRKSKKAETNAASLRYAIRILSEIKKYPGISTNELSKKINRTSLVVQRYIEALGIAGESIEYDKNLKGWNLKNGKSLLMEDL